MRARMRQGERRLARLLAERTGHDLVPRGYYSVVTDTAATPAEVWTRRSPLRGITFEPAAQLRWARDELAPSIAEWTAGPGTTWDSGNGYYESVDTEILYAMVRSRRPSQVVELGSGFSSLVIAQAVARNAAEGVTTSHVAYDPYPRPVVAGSGVDVRELPAQDVPDDVFSSLGPGDVLFVDTSHTVKPGGDVNRIVLDALPLLRPGVVVHFHDILLPLEYHRGWVEQGWHWAEAYLVQAFLAHNPDFEVRWSSSGVWSDHKDELRTLVPSLGDHRPSALWIERVG